MTSTPEQIQFGPLLILDTGDISAIPSGQTSRKTTSSGTQHTYVISGLPGLALNVAYVSWTNGDREVRGLPGSTPSRLFSRLARGNRVSILRFGDHEWMELRVSHITSRQPTVVWSSPRKANEIELNEACGFDVRTALVRIGALELGTRESLIGTMHRRRTDLCVLFPRNSILIPLAAFAAVRVLPIYREEPLTAQ
jgi:hypothetical protein